MSHRARHREHVRKRLKRRAAPGTPPGSLNIDPQAPQPVIQLLAYNADKYIERDIADAEELRAFLGQWPVCWINVDGLGDARTLETIAAIFQLHALAMEDVVNLHQRAKVDRFGDRTYMVTHMIRLTDHLESEQVSLFLGPDFLITFQESPGWDCLEPVRERIRSAVTRVRDAGAGYLAYSILDAIIDHYFPLLEAYGERLEDLEDRIIAQPSRSCVADLHEMKRELLFVRRAIWPQREALNTLVRDEIPHINSETRLYLRDCYDHCVRLIDLVETYREVSSDLMDLYLSSISNRMNEIMKVLTIISTLFIPPTFIVGIYGMNFDYQASPFNMPELKSYYGYPLCLLVMAIIAVGQLFYFRKKGWFGQPKSADDSDK